MILKASRAIISFAVSLILLVGQTTFGNESDPIKILEADDCVHETTIAVPPELFREYETAREQRDELQIALKNRREYSSGIITNSVGGDILVGILSGIVLGIAADRIILQK